jgi:fatty acid desaturase
MASSWDRSARAFRGDLSAAVDAETMRALHAVRPVRHFLVLARQLLVLAVAVLVILSWGARPYAWIPASIGIGFVIFDFTVLLHEVVHEVVVRTRSSRLQTLLGHMYALPSGLSFSQFRRWHLDHHDNLGTKDADPKRHYLTPKTVTRSYKALYLTVALFPIYFRAARLAAAAYPPALQRRIAWERRAAIAFHLSLAALLVWSLGWPAALKLHLLPVFVVFPAAFTVNRLGQHYDVDPRDAARWGTLMRPSPLLWDRIYLWSNYHIEHHYFPRVPFYNLPALHRALRPFFEARGMKARSYGGLLWDWFVRNRAPHTDWSQPPAAGPAVPIGNPARELGQGGPDPG